MSPARLNLTAALLALLAIPLAAWAQNPDPNDKTVVHPLTLDKNPGIPNGRIAMVEGEARPEGVRRVVNQLSILQPAGVALVADDKNDDLRLALWKDVGRCELKRFNVPDWYDRYGFMYYTFMADRYRGQ